MMYFVTPTVCMYIHTLCTRTVITVSRLKHHIYVRTYVRMQMVHTNSSEIPVICLCSIHHTLLSAIDSVYELLEKAANSFRQSANPINLPKHFKANSGRLMRTHSTTQCTHTHTCEPQSPTLCVHISKREHIHNVCTPSPHQLLKV